MMRGGCDGVPACARACVACDVEPCLIVGHARGCVCMYGYGWLSIVVGLCVCVFFCVVWCCENVQQIICILIEKYQEFGNKLKSLVVHNKISFIKLLCTEMVTMISVGKFNNGKFLYFQIVDSKLSTSD